MAARHLISLICAFAIMAAGAQSPEPRALDLRAAIRQTVTSAETTATRRLSEPERAELRRQLSLYSRPQAKGS